MSESEARMEVGRVSVVKYLDEDAPSGVAIYVEYSDDLPLYDALGLLAFAQATTVENYAEAED